VDRSISCEVDLPPGRYEVIPKITAAEESSSKKVEDVVKEMAKKRPEKLRQVGLNFDLSHAQANLFKEVRIAEPQMINGERDGPRDMPGDNPDMAVEHPDTKQEFLMESNAAGENYRPDGDKENAQATGAIDAAGNMEPGQDKQQHPTPPELEEDVDRDADNEAAPIAPTAAPQSGFVGAIPEEFDWPPPGAHMRQLWVTRVAEGHNRGAEHSGRDEQDSPDAWNAVCMLGLRVYAMDPDVTITIVK
jgi:hypothetical protein